MVKLAAKFVPVLVDGDVDTAFGSDYGVSGFPNTVFADPKGKKVSFVAGAVPLNAFLDQLKSALKKIGPIQVKKAVKELEDAAAGLEKARQKSDWKAALRAAAAIEKIKHEGPSMDAARKAKADAGEEAKKRLDAAKALVKEGKVPEAKAALAKIESDFEGLDEAAEAKGMLKEMEPPPPPPPVK